jgi:hypothetical protein
MMGIFDWWFPRSNMSICCEPLDIDCKSSLAIIISLFRGLRFVRSECWPVYHFVRFVWYGIIVIGVCVAGCGGESQVPVGDAAESIRKLALAYVQFAAANKGVGPADQDTLEKFLAKRNAISSEQARAYFVSPRDNQPYIIRWGQRPLGSGLTGAEVPKPSVIILERTGVDGMRYVADGQLGIRQLSDEKLDQLIDTAEVSNRGNLPPK